ncbi:MAG: helix-turn-helix domain-containing protein [Gemmataceae bacterium]
MDTFGKRLQTIRQAAGLSQAGLANLSGIPLGTIREYEQTRREPLLSKAAKLARALQQPLEAFLPDAAPKAPKRGKRKDR